MNYLKQNKTFIVIIFYIFLILILLVTFSCTKEQDKIHVQISITDDSDSSFTIRYYNGKEFLIRTTTHHFSTYYTLPIGSIYKDSIKVDRIVDNLYIFYN